jgi:hypothetical protein
VSNQHPVDRLAAAIARYVNDHPNASDTVEGVGRWWVPEDAVHASTEQLERALDLLVARRIVMRRALPDGRLVYTARIAPLLGDPPLED